MQNTGPSDAVDDGFDTGFDSGRLDQLLALIGPDQSAAFLAQLGLDVAGCDRRIAAGLAGPDWRALRDASHDLISLSGSAGARRLHALAADVNAAARAQDRAALASLAPRIAAEAARLIARIRSAGQKGRPE
jgi:HPt (histidine-containing phosphotransfer) domain-containing protein